MDDSFNIYELPSEGILTEIEKEDKARLEGYLRGRAENDAPNREMRRKMEKEIRRLQKELGDK